MGMSRVLPLPSRISEAVGIEQSCPEASCSVLGLARTSEDADSNEPTETPAPDAMLPYESSLDVLDAAETRPCSDPPHPAIAIGEDGERMLLHVLSEWRAEV